MRIFFFINLDQKMLRFSSFVKEEKKITSILTEREIYVTSPLTERERYVSDFDLGLREKDVCDFDLD